MKNAVCCLFVFCAAAFGQENVAGNAIQKRVQSMNLLAPARYHSAYVFPPAAQFASKLCAIPLLRSAGPGTADRMRIISPKFEPLPGDSIQVPASACDEDPAKK